MMTMNIPEDKLWKYFAVFGTQYVKESQANSLTMEAFLTNAPAYKFWVNKDRNVLAATDSELMRKGLGELTPLTLKEAHEEFGIDVMEEATERTYCKIEKQSA